MTAFSRIFIIKGNANNRRNQLSCPFPILMTPFPVIAFINEEPIRAVNEAAIGAIIAPRNPLTFFISCYPVSVAASINRSDFSNDSTILMISFISSFETNKVNSFLVLTAPSPLFFR